MTDVAKLLSDLSGVPRDKVLSIWEEVKVNQVRLRACPRHRFEGGTAKMGDRKKCLRCGGELSLSHAGEYVRGYRAAGENPDDVWPEFFKSSGP